jgi:hypothetical protein
MFQNFENFAKMKNCVKMAIPHNLSDSNTSSDVCVGTGVLTAMGVERVWNGPMEFFSRKNYWRVQWKKHFYFGSEVCNVT